MKKQNRRVAKRRMYRLLDKEDRDGEVCFDIE